MADENGDPWLVVAKAFASVVVIGLALAEPTPIGEVVAVPIVSGIWGIDAEG